MATVFETVTCTRCGGSGKYSYCQMYGDTCFKCGGTGKQLTKRGAAASAFLRSLRTVKASTVKFGDAVRVDGCPGFSRTTYIKVDSFHTQLNSSWTCDPITHEKLTAHHHLFIEGANPKGERHGLGVFPDSDVRLVPTKAEAAEQIAKALAYQATLTKAGTVMKRKA
jgi:hypothetical protein